MLSETKLQVLKEISSGFSRDEAIWASGYLAGLAGTSVAVADLPPQLTTHTTAVKKITLVYGTETGNSKKLATELAGVAKKKGIQVKLGDLSQYKPKDLAKEEYLFVVISTQGEGEPPILAKKFYDYIHENELNLSNIKFGVLALGDSTYPQFCKTGEDLDTRFEVLGAERIIPLKRCDIDYEEDAHRWLDHIFEVVQNKEAGTSQATPAKASSGRKKYQGKVSAIINLNDITSDKETYHIEIETEEPIAYRPGDALGVIPFNPKSVVEEIIGLTGIDPGKQIQTTRVTASVEELLHQHLNISYLLKTTVAQYAQITGQDIPETRLSLLDLLRIYPVKNAEEFEDIIKVLTVQAPRLYSVSSSPEAHGDSEIHITVAKSEFFINDKKQNGLCSGFLSEFEEDGTVEFYIQEAKHFKLPETAKDIIMIGPGTGIAPFRSFLWERDATGAEGRNWLFFGDRNFVSDFLYQSEFQDFLKTGALTNLDLAFSRDTAEKVYVQHRLQQKSSEVFQWLEGGASVYVCGAKEPMSKDVEETLLHIIQHEGKRNEDEAKNYLEELELSGRYAKDVY
ncbi:flavodoxin domain-containing protein [Elizabethkingia anophelis]|uniref:assimilatory sulfite reductase (NADPH) n=1 Tax=Elizabethkingia anophelis TaxID=1117645 RepID=A0A7Z7PWH0_9FLAO|nr:flavodoxin domain-containing protein [Elizabethkingia anophelis]MCT3630489.1 flavodoxin domain-containing protein [Elizabethkingia anophelis]MCT3634002.1 flavodoxin domain-containing protein [Elizabethkingia anophelis]MCT3692046.1 flavodoxin domain-containing protein [Elizabethkingia anophelis]MCT3720664.1 flavodoxin domain-containing protein [Elizabethkingia anophelis]MCT3724190.1 flavodoxin domain-containing protein [Elizabethkingia anophelis]